ncbi:MAG: hypothetical protein RR860_13955, partial [Janthinobacterium sp.]
MESIALKKGRIIPSKTCQNGNSDSLWVDGKPVEVEKIDDTTVKFNLPSVSAAAMNNIAVAFIIFAV